MSGISAAATKVKAAATAVQGAGIGGKLLTAGKNLMPTKEGVAVGARSAYNGYQKLRTDPQFQAAMGNFGRIGHGPGGYSGLDTPTGYLPSGHVLPNSSWANTSLRSRPGEKPATPAKYNQTHQGGVQQRTGGGDQMNGQQQEAMHSHFNPEDSDKPGVATPHAYMDGTNNSYADMFTVAAPTPLSGGIASRINYGPKHGADVIQYEKK
jgi:hypothetical protein